MTKTKLSHIDKITIFLSTLSLIVASASFIFSYHTWHLQVTPAISCETHCKIVPNTFNTVRNGTMVLSCYTLEITVDIANTANQGCIVHCDPIIHRTLSNQEALDLHLTKDSIRTKDGDNPIDSIRLNGYESYSSTFTMNVYFDVPTTKYIMQKFSNYDSTYVYGDIAAFDPYKATQYLKEIDVTPTLVSFYTEDDPGWGLYYHDQPDIAKPDQLILHFFTNTNLSVDTEIDYLNW